MGEEGCELRDGCWGEGVGRGEEGFEDLRRISDISFGDGRGGVRAREDVHLKTHPHIPMPASQSPN